MWISEDLFLCSYFSSTQTNTPNRCAPHELYDSIHLPPLQPVSGNQFLYWRDFWKAGSPQREFAYSSIPRFGVSSSVVGFCILARLSGFWRYWRNGIVKAFVKIFRPILWINAALDVVHVVMGFLFSIITVVTLVLNQSFLNILTWKIVLNHMRGTLLRNLNPIPRGRWHRRGQRWR